MPIYKDDRGYYFVVNSRFAGKKMQYKSKRYETRKECQQEEAKYLTDNYRGGQSITIGAIVTRYIAEKEQTNKVSSMRDVKLLCKPILDCLGNIPLNRLQLYQYEKYRLKIVENASLSVRYRNKQLEMFASIVKYAEKRFNVTTRVHLGFDYLKDNGEVKPRLFFTYQQFLAFIENEDDLMWRAFFSTLYYCGLRQGEANGLMWSDYDGKYLSINRTVTTRIKVNGENLITSPKTKGSIRKIPVPIPVRKLFDELKASRDVGNQFIFGGDSAIPETTIQKRKNDLCKMANLPQIRIHDFRHSCASYLIHQGASFIAIQHYLGHSSLKETLDTYSHLYEDDLDNLIAKIK